MSAIYVQRGGQKVGPFTTEELEGKVAEGELSSEDLFWAEGMEEWEPLASVIHLEGSPEATAETEPVAAAEEEAAPLPLLEAEGSVVVHNIGKTTITTHAVHLECGEVVDLDDILKVSIQTEKVERFKPVAGCVVVGVGIICLALLELPRTTFTHWAIWGLVLAGLLLWWLRLLLNTLRVGASIVVIDLKDGDERIIRAGAARSRELRDAIRLALPEPE